MSVHLIRQDARLLLEGDGYLEPFEAQQVETAISLLSTMADDIQLKYEAWALEKENEAESLLKQSQEQERRQVQALLEESSASMNEALSAAITDEVSKFRATLTGAFSAGAAQVLIAAGLAKAVEQGYIDADSKVLTPTHTKQVLIEHLGAMLALEEYLFLNKIIQEQEFLEADSAIAVTPTEAFKLDTKTMVKALFA